MAEPRPEVVRALLLATRHTDVPEATWPELVAARKLRAHDFPADQIPDRGECMVLLVEEFLAMLAEETNASARRPRTGDTGPSSA